MLVALGMQKDDWFMLRVRPAYEDIASLFLTSHIKGCEVYYPTGKRKVLPPRASKPVLSEERAVFPGYLFARFELLPKWSALVEYCASQPKLITRLSADGESLLPVYVKNETIEIIKREHARGVYTDTLENPYAKALLGQYVKLPFGPFVDQIAKVHGIEDDVVRVKLRIMKGAKPVFLTFTLEEIAMKNSDLINSLS